MANPRAVGSSPATELGPRSTDNERKEDRAYMDNRGWTKHTMNEVTEVYSKLPDRTGDSKADDVEVFHKFDAATQLQIHTRKKQVEVLDCGVVFFTVDLSTSRERIPTMVIPRGGIKSRIQIRHVKCLAPNHYLVLLYNLEDRDEVMI
ncbi:hypothetical protein R1sor_010914 [Riccia sorocarpa]|uniref:Uncharacterized protein n=1 Tax=Riccia sorocarpa TaxID=122646 RepID=A0ABD3HZE2_9MARC